MTAISLRKANAIQLAIKDLLKGIKIETTVVINEFQDHSLVIHEAQALLRAENMRKLSLMTALREIRKLVGTANATSGINDKLADAASIDKLVIHFDEMINSFTLLDESVIIGKLTKIRSQGETSRWGEDTITTGILSFEARAEFKEEVMKLKKQKQIINDEILALNISITIQLDQSITNTLTTENLL